MRKLLIAILTLTLITVVYADIKISGDARVRPRMDMQDYGDFPYVNESDDTILTTTDTYYLYRARINLKSDIGDGWFFNTKLATNGIAWWTGKFGSGSTPSGDSQTSAGRGTVSFMELYFGYKGEECGLWAGLIPLAGNSALDIHFYPKKVVDIPFLLFNNNATHGFGGFKNFAGNNFNWFISVDDQVTNKTELETGDVEKKDQYSFGFDYSLNAAGFKIQPLLLYTMADDNMPAPMSYGFHFAMPKLPILALSGSFVLSSQSEELIGTEVTQETDDDGNLLWEIVDNVHIPINESKDVFKTEPYDGMVFRIKGVSKLGPGSLIWFYDYATMDWTGEHETAESYGEHTLTNLWVMYKWTVYKSDFGQVNLIPTLVMNTDEADDMKDYSGTRFELTTEIKFK